MEPLILELLEATSEPSFETNGWNIFKRFSSPETLHNLAQRWTWETTEEVQVFRWICESEFCSQATALMIFWLARPQDYTKYSFGAKPNYTNGAFEVIQIILRRFSDGEYQHFGIHYDPKMHIQEEKIVIDDEWKKAVAGEETWYDEGYIKGLYWYTPSELASEIRRCENSDYLNMFANGLLQLNEPEAAAERIMEHPLCDRGTALLLHWRLLSYYCKTGIHPPFAESEAETLNKLRERLQSDDFPPKFEYDPVNDTQNAVLLDLKKQEWVIPDFMKRPV